MIIFEDYCIGCPPEIGCVGSSCNNRRVPVMICDKCKDEVDALWEYEGQQCCHNCIETAIFTTLPIVEV